ncbi:hypothetical protein ES702_01312 [subsurface metagenome]
MKEELKKIKMRGTYQELVESIMDINANLSHIMPLHPGRQTQIELIRDQLQRLTMVLHGLFKKLGEFAKD